MRFNFLNANQTVKKKVTPFLVTRICCVQMKWTIRCEHDLKDDGRFNLVQKPQSEQLTSVEGNIQSVLLSRSELKINFLFLFCNCAFAVILCFNYALKVMLLVCFTLESTLCTVWLLEFVI